MSDFDAFWAAYPNRKAKLDAQKAYAAARQRASAEDILAGVHRYVAGKPDYCDWKLPAGWLRAGRWMDEYDVPAPKPVEVDWFEECKQMHDGACGGRLRHTNKVSMDAYMAKHKAEAS